MLNLLIENHLKKVIEDFDDVAILFSGGMDSLSIMLSCLRLGIKPTLYTFYLKSYVSDDIKFSRKVSKIYNLKLIEIAIDDSSINVLISDVENIIKEFNVFKKTQVQCIYPFKYIAPEIKEKYVLTGLCADDLYGSAKSMAMKKDDIKTFNELRDRKMSDEHASSYIEIKKLIEGYDKIFIAPYKDSAEIVTYFRILSYRQMNSPKKKMPTYLSYKDEIDKHGLYRINSNLQCCSKVRELHAKLLSTYLNNRNLKETTGIYNDMYKKIHK
jgi:Asparagine synthase (glutamine-hydrolyzing)